MYRRSTAIVLLAALGLGLVLTATAQEDAPATQPAAQPAPPAPEPAAQPAPPAPQPAPQPAAKPAEDAPAPATAQTAPAPADKPQSVEQRAAYAIGLNLGRQLAAQPVKLDVNMLVRGINDAVAGVDPALTDEEMEQAFASLQEAIVAQQKQAGNEFLAKNATREGVTTTPSGLQYEVIKPGQGKSPAATDVVTVHYKGTLLDGTVFDSSYERGEPISFPLDGVIAGWTEGVQLMKEGGKFKFYIPSDLAYGAQGTPGGPIGPHSTLIFEVELIKVGQ